jgi:short-subunit dehydrogenase
MKEKCVVVTGAGGGIGTKLVERLVACNARVALIGRRLEKLQKANARAKPRTDQTSFWQCDVGDPDQVKTTFQKIIHTFGTIDVLINNAATAFKKPLVECSLDDMKTIYDTNVFGVFNCTKEALPIFLSQNNGHIINIASLVGLTGMPTYNAYGDSKAAMIRMSEEWRRELAAEHILVTTVFLYFTATKMLFPDHGPDPVAARFPYILPLDPGRVANAIIKAIQKPQKELWLPGYIRWMMAPIFLFPGIGDFLIPILPQGTPDHWRQMESPQ